MNALFAEANRSTETRLLIIDDQQTRYNQIVDIFKHKGHPVSAVLLDDIVSFEKQLNREWDLVIFVRAYDLKVQQAAACIAASKQPGLPLLMFRPDAYQLQDYPQFIERGVYELVELQQPEHFYIVASRALAYSRLLQNERRLGLELLQAQHHAQHLVQERGNAQATIQEGIHIAANQEYLQLFALKQEDDIIGLPLLDLLQPDDLNGFKQRFKKIMAGQFDNAPFHINSLNQNLQGERSLKLEFLAVDDADMLQLSVQHITLAEHTPNAEQPTTINPSEIQRVANVAAIPLYERVNHLRDGQLDSSHTLLMITLQQCPAAVFQTQWNGFKAYLDQAYRFLKDQLPFEVIRLQGSVFVGLVSAASSQERDQLLQDLLVFEQQQHVEIANQHFPLQFKLYYGPFETTLQDDAQLDALLANTFTHAVSHLSKTPHLHFDISQMHLSVENNTQDQVIAPPAQHTEPEFTALSSESPAVEPVNSETLKIETPSFVVAKTEMTDMIAVSDDAAVVTSGVQITAEHIEQAKSQTPLLFNLDQALQRNAIELHYQQLYDKQDSNLYWYEVTASFQDDQGRHDINDLIALNEDPALSVQVDRWILVEACKQLHTFIETYPTAKLIINLNQHILYQDKQLAELLAKLLTIVASKQAHPLIVQFSEEAAVKNMLVATQQFEQLCQEGAEIAIRNAGNTSYTEQILKTSKIHFVKMSGQLSQKLKSDRDLESLQQQVDQYMSLQPVEVLLGNLNDMNMFANAWSVNARYLQGDYFQKPMPQLIDVQAS